MALNKPTTQNMYAQIPSYTSSDDPSPNGWWRVDLEDFFVVHAVVIDNTGDFRTMSK